VNCRISRAFTLLEVLLALVIATGLMIVALYFYQQIGQLRSQSAQEIHKLSTVRLLMDKLTSDLRSAHSLGYFNSGFVGGGDFIQFVKTELPAIASWPDDASAGVAPPESDLKRVGYTLVVSIDETNQAGSLMRWEEPGWPADASSAMEELGAVESSDVAEVESVASPGVGQADRELDSAGSTIFTDHVQYLHFRYFDGTEWQPTWDGLGLPMGVEVQISPQAWIEDGEEGGFPEELFRRVIHVPENRADYEAPEDLSWAEEADAGESTNAAPALPDAEELSP
jgi:type II secretory pathway component PulJ